MDVVENITLPIRMDRRRVNRERLEELLELLGLQDRRNHLPNQLSGGQQQRVGIARALAARPEILLMDEPFGAVDGITRKQLQDAIRDIHERTKATIVFVTHDLREAVRLGSWILIMNEGEVVQQGTPEDVRNNPNGDYAAQFIKQLECE